MSEAALQFARADDGTRIAFRLREVSAARPRVAFLHSLGMDHALWTPVAERLGDSASLLCLDLRGHGRSDKPPPPYGTERLARDLRGVLDHLGWERTVLVGASLGGCVSLQFAADHADRLCALGLVDTTAWYGPDAPMTWNARARRAREEGLAAMIPFQETRWFTDAFRVARPDAVERCVHTFLGNDVPAFAAMSEMLGRFDGRNLLPRIGVPTAILVGEEDYATPVAMSQALQRGILDARLTVVPSARHLVQIERPDAVANMVMRLLTLVETA
ncbi:alpha/beta fold hydrolase [Hydrogenophaga crocea]|uniref:Alpha/beta fold hydrolase n=1 Tax=Hydrogenophaga crocea TaxID=2716225 RepID=A0A6G8IK58_9BURK|nr:alpha/beta fold hydrolase [Hydrogenophaga crocea]QIM53416.1 alpha/beta fold hydrolase [Hydrogenophaga crocea]